MGRIIYDHTMRSRRLEKVAMVCEFWFKNTIDGDSMLCIKNITQIICAFYDGSFLHIHDYDGNGIVFWAGTNYGEEKWMNPARRGLIRVNSSGWYTGDVRDMVANTARFSYAASKEGAWASIAFQNNVMVKPTAYTLAHTRKRASSYLNSWDFEGSSDGVQWTLIKRHSGEWECWNPATERTPSQVRWRSHTWITSGVDTFFNRFRVRMTGKNSNNTWFMMAHALEIY